MFQDETQKEPTMISLLIIADDLTGALDTGIQFARYNTSTKVYAKNEFSRALFYDTDTEVLVVDTETRHLSPKDAYKIVYDLSKLAVEAGVKYIYKKTDSALRGNIGSELAAVLDASNEKFLAFIPALPSMNRVTIQGIQYIDKIQVHESVFGSDPYAPVKSSFVKDLFREVTHDSVVYSKEATYDTDFVKPTIGIFDAQTNDDLRRIGNSLHQNNQQRLFAGCTGFAAMLPEIIGIKKTDIEIPILKSPLLVICGSVNPISRLQIEYGEEMGFDRIVLSPEQMLEEDYFSSDVGKRWLNNVNERLDKQQVVMIDSGISQPNIIEDYMSKNRIDAEEVRTKITRALGTLMGKFYKMGSGYKATVMIIGGDTLKGFIEEINCEEINLLCEITMGTVLSTIDVFGRRAQIVTKSGGFGRKDLILYIANITNKIDLGDPFIERQ